MTLSWRVAVAVVVAALLGLAAAWAVSSEPPEPQPSFGDVGIDTAIVVTRDVTYRMPIVELVRY